MTSADRIARARSMQSPDDAVQLYSDWADHYDHDVFEVMGFTGTHRIAELLAQHLPDRATPVIDLGCGTGVAGVRLAELGFGTIDGLDISPEMLDVARPREVYRNLFVADLTQPIPVGPNGAYGPYGGSVSAGTFTSGHVGGDAVAGIVQLLRPGAVLAWVVASTLWPSFEPAMTAAGLHTVEATLEPIRRDGPPEAMMVIAVLD